MSNKLHATPNRPWVTKMRRISISLVVILAFLPLLAAVTQIDLTTQVKGTLPVANGGTGVTTSTGTTNLVLSNGPTIDSPTFTGDVAANTSVGTFAIVTKITNDTTTGTTANLLAKLSAAAPSKVILTGTGDTSGIVGVCLVNCGTTGSGGIAVSGQAGCTADNSITAGDYIVEGTTTAGRCKSAGATPPTANQVIGRSLTTTSTGSTATILLFGSDIPDTASATNFADNEVPSGSINGSNVTFTLAHSVSPAASLLCLKNGQGQVAGGADYTLSGATITYGVAPITGTDLRCWYRF